jgi:small subunit ribosomal protein S4
MIKLSNIKLKKFKKLDTKDVFVHKLDNNLSSTNKENIINIERKMRSFISNDFKYRLLEKKKLRFIFGITNKKLHDYVKKIKQKKYFNKLSLTELINSRLDCIVYSIGFAKSIVEAKQFINHGHILLNNKIQTIPSTLCQLNDFISIKLNSKLIDLIKCNLKTNNKTKNQNFLIDSNSLTGQFISYTNLTKSLLKYNEFKIIEFYSNK